MTVLTRRGAVLGADTNRCEFRRNVEVPEEFRDEVTDVLMTDPVSLPSSRRVCLSRTPYKVSTSGSRCESGPLRVVHLSHHKWPGD